MTIKRIENVLEGTGVDAKDVDAIMQTIPAEWRVRWCGGEYGPCACMGCVQIGNRYIMVKVATGRDYRGDPEYIDESKIPPAIYEKYKITKAEWQNWMRRQGI